MNNIMNTCAIQKQCGPVNYSKVVTGGNDPLITKRLRYSQYIHNTMPRTVYNSTAAERLAAQGITYKSYFSPVLVSLEFTNLKQFNLPREKVFSRTTVR